MAAADTANTANTATTNTAEVAAPPEPQARHVIYCSGNSEIKKNIICSPFWGGRKLTWGPFSLHPTSRGEFSLLRQRNVTQSHQSLWSEQSNPIQSNPQNNFRPKERIQQGWCQFLILSIANSVVQRRNARNGLRQSTRSCTNGYTPKVWIKPVFFSSSPHTHTHTHTHTHIYSNLSLVEKKKFFKKKNPPFLT